MCKVVCVGAVLFFFVSLASAQIPSGNVFVGYSFENTSSSTLNLDVDRPNLHGWDASFEGKLLPWVGLVADVSGHYGSENFVEPTPDGPMSVNVTGHEQEYLFGPRLSVKVGKFTPFGEVLVGVAHIHTGGSLASPANTSLASAYGGGIDYKIIRPIAVRLEGDYLRTSFYSATQNNFRLSTGVVFRF